MLYESRTAISIRILYTSQTTAVLPSFFVNDNGLLDCERTVYDTTVFTSPKHIICFDGSASKMVMQEGLRKP